MFFITFFDLVRLVSQEAMLFWIWNKVWSIKLILLGSTPWPTVIFGCEIRWKTCQTYISLWDGRFFIQLSASLVLILYFSMSWMFSIPFLLKRFFKFINKMIKLRYTFPNSYSLFSSFGWLLICTFGRFFICHPFFIFWSFMVILVLYYFLSTPPISSLFKYCYTC